jgi:hypothetical protein
MSSGIYQTFFAAFAIQPPALRIKPLLLGATVTTPGCGASDRGWIVDRIHGGAHTYI